MYTGNVSLYWCLKICQKSVKKKESKKAQHFIFFKLVGEDIDIKGASSSASLADYKGLLQCIVLGMFLASNI